MHSSAVLPSPVGALRVEADERAITKIWFHAGEPLTVPSTPLLAELARQLAEYFSGERRQFDLPIAPSGTAFQCEVWHALEEIPYGATWSYAELARHIGRPSAVRAVGAANGQNPIPIVIPCHRVIGSNGSLTGFGGGLGVKQQLLALEGVRTPLLPFAHAKIRRLS